MTSPASSAAYLANQWGGRTVRSRQPADQKPPELSGDLKPGPTDASYGTRAVRFSNKRDPCPARRPVPLAVTESGRSAQLPTLSACDRCDLAALLSADYPFRLPW